LSVVHGDIACRNVVFGPAGAKLTNLCAMVVRLGVAADVFFH
jgi:hypothetical protein